MSTASGNGEAPTIAPDTIDESYVPQLVEGVHTVEVDGERVVIGFVGAQVLNPTATLLWQFLDGEAALAELIDDFSAVLDAPRSVVEHDTLDFVRNLGRRGFLVGVAEPVEVLDVEPAAPPPIPMFVAGEELEPFRAADLDGVEHSLVDYRGRKVFLVNWHPGCGYCGMIAGTLATLEAPLADAGVDLVLVAGGNADDNRALVEGANLRAPLLLKGDDVEPFGGLGTPAAILLDEQGHIVADLASGAYEVPERAAALAGVELPEPEPHEEEGAEKTDADARYLPAGGMCGPAPASGPKVSWAGTLAFAHDDVHVGVRYNNDATAALLEQLFAKTLVTDTAVPDNYSVALTDGPSKDLELLVRGALQLVRSRSKKRVLVGLLRYLSDDLTESDTTLLRVAATPVVGRDGRAMLIPAGLNEWMGKLQPRFAKRGLAVVDVPSVFVDVRSAELVVPEPSIVYDAAVLDEVDRDLRLGRTELPMVESGRYPLSDWFIHAHDPEIDGRGNGSESLRPAMAVASTVRQCFSDDVETIVADLTTLFERVAVRPLSFESAAELAGALPAR